MGKGYSSASEYTGIGYGAVGIAIESRGNKCTCSYICYITASEYSAIGYGEVGIAIEERGI